MCLQTVFFCFLDFVGYGHVSKRSFEVTSAFFHASSILRNHKDSQNSRMQNSSSFSHFYKLDGSIFSSLLCDSSYRLNLPRWVIDEPSMSHWTRSCERMSHSFTHRIMSHPNSNIFKYYDIWFIYLSEKWFQVQEFFIFPEFWKTINIITTEAYLFSRKLVNKKYGRSSPFRSSNCGELSPGEPWLYVKMLLSGKVGLNGFWMYF